MAPSIPTPGASVSQASEAKQEPGEARFWKRYVSSFKPWWPSRSRATRKLATPRPAKAMVQAEMSLEKVRVVRNDLSDSDVEIVMAKATQPVKTLKAENPEPSTTAGLIPTPRNLGTPRLANLAGRLFGAGKH